MKYRLRPAMEKRRRAEEHNGVCVGWTLTEDQTGDVQRDEACGFEHDSSSSGVRLSGGEKCPVSAPVPATSG